MHPSEYGKTAEIIGQLTDPQQLTQMMRNPQYAGFTNIIVARLQEINRMRGAAQGAQPQQPPVAQQAVQGMSRGGIVSFRHGGKVQKYARGHEVVRGIDRGDASQSLWNMIAPSAEQKAHPWGVPSTAASAVNPAANLSDQEQQDIWSGANHNYPVDKSQYAYGAPGDVPTVIHDPNSPFGAGDYAWAKANGINIGEPTPKPISQLPPLAAREIPQINTGGIGILSNQGGGDYPTTSFQEYADQINAFAGKDENDIKAREELDTQKKRSPWMNVMMGGLTMAEQGASNPRAGILGNFATGAKTGLEGYGKDRDAMATRQDALNKASRAERMGIAGLAVTETGQDKRLQAQLAMQKLQLRIGQKPFQALEEKMQRYAIDRANADRDKGIKKPFSDYELDAFHQFSSQIYGADMRSEASQMASYQKEKHDWVLQGKQGYFPATYDEWRSEQFDGAANPDAKIRK